MSFEDEQFDDVQQEAEVQVIHKHKRIYVKADDPTRCQAHTAKGECYYQAVPGTKFCLGHGGAGAALGLKKRRANMYRIQQWQERMGEFANTDKVKDLRNDIGLLRILIEERFKVCQTPVDLLMNSGPLSSLITTLANVIDRCHKIEKDLKVVIDAEAALSFADGMVDVIKLSISEAVAITDVEKLHEFLQTDFLDQISARFAEKLKELAQS